jgi:peptidoglycan/LPS O-acetylase OafA/YrhL
LTTTAAGPTRLQSWRLRNFVEGKSTRSRTGIPFGTRLKSLDGVRGLAVLAVVCFHTLRIKHSHDIWGKVWVAIQESTWAGVDLFFVLSGFLITGILLDSRRSTRYFTNFYARRTLRIAPVYYGVLIAALLVAPLVIGVQRMPVLHRRLIESQLWLWTYTANFLQASGAHTLPGFGHFWSLAVEEQFYWFWPLVVFFSSRRILLRICIAVCCVLPIVRFLLLEHGSTPWALRQYTFTRIDTLLFGAMVAIVIRDRQWIGWARTAVPWLAVASILALIWIGSRFGFIPFEARTTLILGYSAIGTLSAVLIFRVATQDYSKLSKAMSSNVLAWFGNYSYGIYIFHIPVALAVSSFAGRQLTSARSEFICALFYFGIVLGISSGLAFLVWHCYEVHFLSLKKYFTYSTSCDSSASNWQNEEILKTVNNRPATIIEPGSPAPHITAKHSVASVPILGDSYVV